jgi:5-methylcytosine-specific restriction endonuclease McrBC regulatory subunit McrC
MKSIIEMIVTQKSIRQNKLKLNNLCFQIKESVKSYCQEDKVKYLKGADSLPQSLMIK